VPTVKDGQKYFSVREAARLLGVKHQTIRNMIGAGELEAEQLRLNGDYQVKAESLAKHHRFSDRSEPQKTSTSYAHVGEQKRRPKT
jgi:excisionase family DNA binding protein